MNDVITVLLGAAAGLIGGLLGVGGGILFVPALTIFQDKPQVEAEAASLLAIVPVAIAAVWRQRGYGNLRLREGLLIGALSPLGVGVGVVVANAVSERLLELAFAGLLIVVASRLLWHAWRPRPDPGQASG
ncbi:MAG TPA: sulfite exporter TauE/SafE family protein [Solirubrobacterales bacterium]|nr:sulfite exporter TauE/SafE family protein [Solirubrobacterales bacterium]